MLKNNWFKYLVEKVFFDRWNALGFCIFISTLSYTLEVQYNIKNLFSSSGTFLTIAGLFLNIKLTAHFHLKLPNGEPLGIHSKYALITGEACFGGDEPEWEKIKKIKEVESDEIWGAGLMISGTLLWGYGSYFT